MTDRARLAEIERLGLDQFLTKPYTAGQLLGALRKALDKR